MVATVELQLSAQKFTRALLEAFRTNPICLPGAQAGLQLQRLRFQDVQLRHDKTKSFQVNQILGPYDQALPWTWIEGKQAQLALILLVDVTCTSVLNDNANTLVAFEHQIPVTAVLDIDAVAVGGAGRIDIAYTLAEVITPVQNLPGGTAADAWLKDQLGPMLPHRGSPLDLSGLTGGKEFFNAGLAVDGTGAVVAIRGELPLDISRRWEVFRNGGVVNALGSNDWALLLSAADLKLALWMQVEPALRDAVKGSQVDLISVGVEYSPQPGRAVFIVTPYFHVPVLGTENVPVSITLWADQVAGELVVDFDGYGIRDKVGNVLKVADIVISLILPMVGPFVASALNGAVNQAMHTLSSVGAQNAQDALAGAKGGPFPSDITVKELPGEPFRYRGRAPFPQPPGLDGRVEALVATPDGVAIAGSWAILNFNDGEMTVDVSQWGWQAPEGGCGLSSGANADLEERPTNYLWLYAEIALSNFGSSPISICGDVVIVSGPATSSGWRIVRNGSMLPTTIELHASSTFADFAVALPIVLEVRTTAGVFRVQLDPPPALTPGDIRRAEETLRVRQIYCDAHVLTPGFGRGDHFDLSWITNPLLDPDPRQVHFDHLRLEVAELVTGSRVVLEEHQGRTIGEGVVGANGAGFVETLVPSTMRAPRARVLQDERADGERRAGAPGVLLNHARMNFVSGLRLSQPVVAAAATPLLAHHFLLAGADRIVFLDASRPTQPRLGAEWSLPGVQGLVSVGRAAFAFGATGLFRITAEGDRMTLNQLSDRPTEQCAVWREGLATLSDGEVDLRNAYGALTSRLHIEVPVTSLTMARDQLVLNTRSGLWVGDTAQARVVRCLPRQVERPGATLSASTGGRFFACDEHGRCDELQLAGQNQEFALVARYPALPWMTRLARAGRIGLHPTDGYSLCLLEIGAWRIASPPGSRS